MMAVTASEEGDPRDLRLLKRMIRQEKLAKKKRVQVGDLKNE